MSLAPFVGTPPYIVKKMLELTELKPWETLYDLGCGDGRVILMAAQEFGARAVGVELDRGRYITCLKKVQENHLGDRVRVIHEDLMKVDISPADVVTLYLLTSANEKVKPNLERYLKKGARVVSHDFEIPGWRPVRIQEVTEPHGYSHTIYVYKKS
ncbi:MAG: SAM-dependent methyltransferase [Candidatus Bathyarchaeia archaeon]